MGDDRSKPEADKTMREATRLVTAGRRKEWTHGVVNPPVYRASTCLFESYAEFRERTAAPSERHLFYGRKGTPTQWALEEAITDLHGAAGTMLFPSGVAAIAHSIMACTKTGDNVLITDSAYEPTRRMTDGLFKRFGLTARYYDPRIGAGIADLISETTSCIVTESPGSLTFEIQDIPAIAAAAHAHGATVITDNTWASPLNLRPLDLGADIAVEAVTKYMAGHSDVMMGSASASPRVWKRLQNTAFATGQMVGGDDAYSALKGLRTMGVRLQAYSAAALDIARWLENQPNIHSVLHPALPSHPDHDLFKRDFKAPTGLFSIVLDRGDYGDTAPLVDHMRLFKMGFSWGGYESLILPSDPSATRSATQWDAPGPVLRLQIGLEDVADLKADLADGLARWRAHMGL